MNDPQFRLFFGIFIISCVVPLGAYAQTDLTPEQLVLLMKASREQYNGISAKMKATSYQYDADNKAEPKIKSTREIISRWTKDKSFSQTIQTKYREGTLPKDYPPTTIYTCVITSKWSKRLVEVPDGRRPRGYIMPGRAFEQELPFYTVYTALWGLCGYPWEKMNLDEATITRDEETSLYIMKVKIGDSPKGPFLRLYVDTSKGYIPIKQEPLKHDGTLMIRYECSDFHQRNGLWIPYRYSWFDPKVNFGAVYEVQEVAVNQPIPSNLLDFEFPEGTIVSDDRIGSTYTVGKASTGQA
ncbi:MAG: hypothetical protein J7M30_05385, partial [Deltaproteobacteria bacterium]|nr:hypothetical protein [Deltaproteobacteria bacterium]